MNPAVQGIRSVPFVRTPWALFIGCSLLALAAWAIVAGYGGAGEAVAVRTAMETAAQLARVHGVEDVERLSEDRLRAFLTGIEAINLRGTPEAFASAFRAWRDEWRLVLVGGFAQTGVPSEMRGRVEKARERLRAEAAKRLRGAASRRGRELRPGGAKFLQGPAGGPVAGLQTEGGFEVAEGGGVVAAAIAHDAERVGGIGVV